MDTTFLSRIVTGQLGSSQKQANEEWIGLAPPSCLCSHQPHLQLRNAHLMIDLLLIPPLVLGHCDVGQLYLQLQHLPHLLPRRGWLSTQQHPQLLHVVQVGSEHLSRPWVSPRAQQQVLPKPGRVCSGLHLCSPSLLMPLLTEASLDDPVLFLSYCLPTPARILVVYLYTC